MAHDDQTFPERSGVSAFGSLAAEVLSVLTSRHVKDTGPGILANHESPFAHSILERRITTRSHFNAADLLEELRALRLSDVDIVDHCIPQAARGIGLKWEHNEMGFAEVTIASSRLQSLLTQIEFVNPACEPMLDCPFDILLVAPPNEQHTIGCFVAAAQLRRRGAIVETMCGHGFDMVLARLESCEYDAVLISGSRPRDLEMIQRLAIDSKTTNAISAPLFVLGGIVLDKVEGLDSLPGIDLVTSDVDVVIQACEQRSIHPYRRATR